MVQWTAEKDQIIIRGVFKFHDIKSSASLLEYLAREIGDDCTSKAVSHRLTNIRNGGKPCGARSNGSVTNTPTKANTPKTPRSRAKATPKKKKATDESDSGGPEGIMDDEEELVSPTAARGKRGLNAKKPSYAESESDEEGGYVPMAKRVKTEPVDEDNESSFGVNIPEDDEV